MDNIIDKTKKLIDSFESSELISKLDYYKRIVIGNKELLDLIKRYNNSTDNYEKLSLKEKIYKYDEYREYMKYYNELFYYIMGKIKNRKYCLSLVNKQDKILRSKKMKILIVAHPYVVYDEYLCGNIIRYFKDEDIDILYSDRLNRKIAISYAEDFSNTLYFLYSKENIGSSFYYKDCVDGIVFLSSFPCASDSLVNELAIRKLKDVPVINIIIDDSTATSGLMTRLESFVDIIKARRDNG